MPVFNDANGNIFHTEGSRIVWSTTRPPALLLPDSAVTVPIDISFPDFSKSNAYGFNFVSGDRAYSTCISFISIDPQEWDSGLSLIASIPAGCNYFETEMTISRIVEPSPYLDRPIPDSWGSGTRHMPDGNSGILEGIGPFVRMFAFERSGTGIYLRRKQSVADLGRQIPWNNPNNNTSGSDGYRAGWTYGGNPNAHPVYRLDYRGTGNIAKRRGESNQCSLSDVTSYYSLWRGSVTITPGYIK